MALGLITTGLEDSVQTTFNEGGAEITVSNGTSIGSSSGEISSDYIDKIKNISDVQDVVLQKGLPFCLLQLQVLTQTVLPCLQ